MRTLHNLGLNHCQFASFANLLRVLADFPLLEVIELHGVQWKTSDNAFTWRPRACNGAFSHIRHVYATNCTLADSGKRGNLLAVASIVAAPLTGFCYSRAIDAAADVPVAAQEAAGVVAFLHGLFGFSFAVTARVVKNDNGTSLL